MSSSALCNGALCLEGAACLHDYLQPGKDWPQGFMLIHVGVLYTVRVSSKLPESADSR